MAGGRACSDEERKHPVTRGSRSTRWCQTSRAPCTCRSCLPLRRRGLDAACCWSLRWYCRRLQDSPPHPRRHCSHRHFFQLRRFSARQTDRPCPDTARRSLWAWGSTRPTRPDSCAHCSLSIACRCRSYRRSALPALSLRSPAGPR